MDLWFLYSIIGGVVLKKKTISFIGLAVTALLLSLMPVQTTAAANNDVIFTIRDSSFLTLTSSKYQDLVQHKLDSANVAVKDSFVPGLTVWQFSNSYSGYWSLPSEDPWGIGFANKIYEVGPNLFLSVKQTLQIPVGKITRDGLGVYSGSSALDNTPWQIAWFSKYTATVQNDGPVAIWQSPAYQTPVQWVNPGESYNINQAYFSYDSGLWFDIGANQWIPAFYLNGNLGNASVNSWS
ncbi:hypothetical protein FC83_GL000133 [Agrilactobacillus composti DSM 18527 = JCM 14202]|uniref:Surface layer protein A domain-containing protein n=1 Tax=Agrilactobacillus composti DSM 18527 = JCM 14202 TaxID=1423734 RepID=A0A0R1Y0P7_9LACO|nr:hypothetical protein FC83_GL000133 [Agrilactobacillus composti DSM 18527 = JCM 14202]